MSGQIRLILSKAKSLGLKASVVGKTVIVKDPNEDQETYFEITRVGQWFSVNGWIKETPIREMTESAWQVTEFFECA